MPSRMRTLFHHADYWAPDLDVQATSRYYVVTIKLPGLTKNEVSVMVDDGVLTLRGHRDGVFTRSISLPDDVEEGTIVAQYKAGVLVIKLTRRVAPVVAAAEYMLQ